MIRRWDKSKPPLGPFTLNRDSGKATGLVAWWPMGGASALNLVPDPAGAAHMTLAGAGAPAMVLGDVGQPCFSVNTNPFLVSSVVPVTAWPLSLSAWVRPFTLPSVERTILSISNTGSTNPLNRIYITTANVAACQSRGTGTNALAATSSVALTTAKWIFVGGTINSDASANAVWVDYIKTVSGVGTADTMAACNTTTIGALHRTTDTTQFDGLIGECGIYNILRDDTQMLELADPSKRFELWYPLRSRKWFTAGAAPSLKTRRYYDMISGVSPSV